MKRRKGYADGPFGQIHYQEAGSGEPLLLLHQSPSSSEMFEAAYQPLAERGIRAIGGRYARIRPVPRPRQAALDSGLRKRHSQRDRSPRTRTHGRAGPPHGRVDRRRAGGDGAGARHAGGAERRAAADPRGAGQVEAGDRQARRIRAEGRRQPPHGHVEPARALHPGLDQPARHALGRGADAHRRRNRPLRPCRRFRPRPLRAACAR